MLSLIQSATNVKLGRKEDRSLLYVVSMVSSINSNMGYDMIRTGVHTVADVFCLGCNDRLGWFYHKAADHSQKYKEGSHVSISFVCDIW